MGDIDLQWLTRWQIRRNIEISIAESKNNRSCWANRVGTVARVYKIVDNDVPQKLQGKETVGPDLMLWAFFSQGTFLSCGHRRTE